MRRKILKISVEVMERLLSGPAFDVIAQEGFPQDGKIVGISFASTDVAPEPRAILILVIESSTFDAVSWGDPTPEMVVRFSSANFPVQAQ